MKFYIYIGQFLCPSSGVFHCTHSNDICHTVLLTTCEQDQDGMCHLDPTSYVEVFKNIPCQHGINKL